MDLHSINIYCLSEEERIELKSLLENPDDRNNLYGFVNYYENFVKNNLSAAYLSSVKISFNHLKKFFVKNIQLMDIKPIDIENFLDYARGKAEKGYRVYYKTIKAAFSKAVDLELINKNPFRKIKLPKKQKISSVFLSRNETGKIIEKIKSEVIRNIVVFTHNTGLRRDEVTSLQWNDVNLSKKLITIGSETFTSKNREQRIIPLSLEAYNILIKYYPAKIIKARGHYVFCKSGGFKLSGDYVSKQFKKAVKDAGFDNRITFHTLRHSYASFLVQKGISIYKVQKLLGHSDIKTTSIYSHVNLESLREAAEVFDKPLNNNYKKIQEN